jgi:serine/threonine protein kinase
MTAQLEVIAGPDTGRSFAIEPGQTLVVGRGWRTGIRLRDHEVSRVHCVLRLAGGRFCLTDIGSNSGTLVNGRAIASHDLAPGDTIQIGRTTLRLSLIDVHNRATVLPLCRCGAKAMEPCEMLPDHSPATAGPLTGRAVSHYKVLSLLARGQSRMVYKARDERDGKIVAFKVFGREHSESPECFDRFIGAVRAVVGLRHENLVQVYAGAGEPQSLCWVAMEYVDGESLTQVIRRIGPANMLDWRYALNIAVHIARALEFAHCRQIIHCNVSPANILVHRVDNIAKLKWPIMARATEGMLSCQATQPGEPLPDLRFMPPEQTFGEVRLDTRSDIYSLGATLYAMLTGRPPLQGYSHTDTINQIRYGEPVKPKKYQLAIWEPFQDVVMAMMAKRPEDRFDTATGLLHQLEQVAKFQGIKI